MSRKPVFREVDALDLLTRDHDAIKRLFKDYERLLMRPADNERKAEIVGKICFALSLHAQIEDEIFYPAVRAAISPDKLTHHALRGHGRSKELIARLDEMEPGDAGYDHAVALLAACATLYMDEERQALFPQVRQSRLDTLALGVQLVQRQKALHQDVTRLGLPPSKTAAPSWPTPCRVVMA